MKKFTKVCLIVAAVLGGVGLILCGIASAMGGYGAIRQMADAGELNHGKWHIQRDGIYYGTDEDAYGAEHSVTKETDETDGETYRYEIGEARNLDIDISAAEILFTESESDNAVAVTLYDCKKNYYTGEVKGDTLHIEYELENVAYYGDDHAKIVIAIPTGMEFDDIDIDMGAANAIFELSDVSCNTLRMDVGAANVTAEEFHVKELFDVSVGAGNLEIKDGFYKNINLSCGMGSADMQGAVSGNVMASCGMGDMDIRLEGNPEAYNYNLSCGMGDMTVNGVKYSGIAGEQQIKNEGAIGIVEIDCGMGNVDFTIE